MRLNLGAGDDYREGFVNIDMRDDCGADLVCDARTLPYPDNSVEEILALDFLEHFSKFQTDALLAEWHRVLRPGGTLSVKMPNLHVLAVQLAYWHEHPSPQLDDLINCIYGGHRWGPDGAWDTHHTGFTPTTIALVLQKAGFDVLSCDHETNMTVVGKKR
jgi:ubiquinone/menaquinone biosynthesis C-methylase UbiE